MSKISLVAKLTIAEGQNEPFETALHELIAVSAEESGLEIYSAHKADDTTYWFFELYSDAAAVEAHGTSDNMKQAMRALGGFLAGAPEVHHMTPIVAKGLDL